MKIMILGGDGYLGWPTAMHFSKQGHEVIVTDNFLKRRLEMEEGLSSLWPVPHLHRRSKVWKEVTGNDIIVEPNDLRNSRAVYKIMETYKPDAIVHYAEQPSAPYSMQGLERASLTQHNNVIGTLNLLFAMQAHCPEAHLVKLGTMGEYGTPNIDIEEGYITIDHNGRSDTLPFPKQPFSFYHLSKVHDSNNIMFCCKNWGLRSTDLNQGVVYGVHTDDTKLHPELGTSFHYDDIFGTVLNRFCVQAVVDHPLTVYGKGGQTRTFLNIRDTLKCVELAVTNPADEGEFRVFNQFTETFSVLQLAEIVKDACSGHGIDVKVDHIPNPRIEKEEHYYNPKNDKLLALGLYPLLLSDVLINEMVSEIGTAKDQVDHGVMLPRVKWRHH
ncbi:MAG: NAD-dependent epimerase/dehydratase family protein [Alphaproteobacteria bacterium]|nr:NAD-dependent epimerase/dehydratase family protein [Alphaproteobacteria bacterium]